MPSPPARLGWLVPALAAIALLLWVGTAPREPGDPAATLYADVLDGRQPLGHPEVGEEAVRELYAASAHDHPTAVVDLSGAGFRVVAAGFPEIDGKRRRITLYSDGDARIICDYRFVKELRAVLPAKERSLFFRRDGLTFCVTRIGDEVCILVTRMSLGRTMSRLLGWV